MKNVSSTNMRTPYKSGIGWKLVLLFLAGFLTIVVGGFVWDLFSGLAENQTSQAEMALQQPTIVIDPKLESDLAKVLNFENNQNLADLKDPFFDKSGISRSENNPTGSVQRTSSSGTSSASTGQQSTASKTVADSSSKGSSGKSGGGSSQSNGSGQQPVVKEDTMTRILKRDEDIRLGRPVLPLNEIIAIEDLLPVGVVSGGSGQDEILLYSQSADRTFSYTVGTKFWDGVLSGIQRDGAVFTYSENQKAYLKSWVRSIQPRSATTSAIIGSSNETLAAGGN